MGGNKITKGVATIPGHCISSACYLAQSSVFWWEDSLWQGPAQQEERCTRQDVLGGNEINQMKKSDMNQDL